MANFQRSVVVSAPAEKVWSYFEDIGSYVSKLEPHTLSFEIVPSGKVAVGQKVHAFVAAGRRKVEIFSEVTGVVPGKKIVETHVPNETFRRLVEIVTLEPTPNGTLVKLETEYEPRGIRGLILAFLFARRTMEKNFAATLSNLKAMVESGDST